MGYAAARSLEPQGKAQKRMRLSMYYLGQNHVPMFQEPYAAIQVRETWHCFVATGHRVIMTALTFRNQSNLL